MVCKYHKIKANQCYYKTPVKCSHYRVDTIIGWVYVSASDRAGLGERSRQG